jgi:hypothetical protein
MRKSRECHFEPTGEESNDRSAGKCKILRLPPEDDIPT